MTELRQVYKCEACGNIVEVLHAGPGTLVCCNQDMVHLAENTVDAATEKHVPVVEQAGSGVNVKVGSVEHPMADDHYIEWIEIVSDGRTCRKYLKPGEKPEATFEVGAGKVVAREYCNLHGFWKTE